MEAQQYLKKFGLSVTDSRKAILDIFFGTDGALSHGEIEREINGVFDRVTVYRTLQTFLDKGIVHQVPTTANTVLYALCNDTCGDGHHHDNHVHFECSACGITQCLESIIVPDVKLPKGYKKEDIKMIVTGICSSCR
jgi:Fur family ferric uptake transcriptional regulator